MKTLHKMTIVMVLFAVLLSGCYWNDEISPSEVGAKLYKNRVESCTGAGGVETDMRYFSDLEKISIATLTFEVEDAEVATKDNQLVGVRITIQARRKADCDSVKGFLSNWSHLRDDAILQDTIDATAREGIKNGTRQFTLTELLDDRNGLSTAITEQLTQDAGKYNAEIVNVTIENVAIAPEYAQVLQDTAQLKAQQDYELRRQTLVKQKAETDLYERQQEQLVLAEQLKVEKANTLVEVEIARRAGEKTKAANEVYQVNEQAFELERLRLMKEVFNNKTVIFLPEGSDPNMIFGMNGIVPVTQP